MTYILCFQTPLSFYRSISVELFFLLIQPRPQASLPGRGGVMGLIIRGSLGVVGLLRTRKGTPCRFCWVSWQKCSVSDFLSKAIFALVSTSYGNESSLEGTWKLLLSTCGFSLPFGSFCCCIVQNLLCVYLGEC